MDAQIELLSLASSDDESVLSLPLPDRVFGFHAQQAVEKQLKIGQQVTVDLLRENTKMSGKLTVGEAP